MTDVPIRRTGRWPRGAGGGDQRGAARSQGRRGQGRPEAGRGGKAAPRGLRWAGAGNAPGRHPDSAPPASRTQPPSPSSFLGPLLGPSWELIPQCAKSPWGAGVASSPHRRPARLSRGDRSPAGALGSSHPPGWLTVAFPPVCRGNFCTSKENVKRLYQITATYWASTKII